MRSNLCESILKSHSENEFVDTGETIYVSVDLMICDDLTTFRAIQLFKQMNGIEPVNKDKILITCEHFTPPSNLLSAEIQNRVRQTAKLWGIENFRELGKSGIGSIVALNDGIILPGMLVIGNDPIVGALGGVGCYATAVGAGDIAYLWKTGKIHLIVPNNNRIELNNSQDVLVDGIDIALTLNNMINEDVTYSSFEFMGHGALGLSLDDRLELAYFMVETGAKNAIIPPSENLFVEMNLPVDPDLLKKPDRDYISDFSINLDEIKPMIDPPDDKTGIAPVEEIEETEIDLIIVGGGMGGSLKNLRTLDKIIGKNKIHPNVRFIVYPGSSEIFRVALKDGIIERFVEAGALVCAPGRGYEGYGNRGICTKDEKVLINGSSNHQGMIGHVDSMVYLAGTRTCAASALAGKIIPPGEVS